MKKEKFKYGQKVRIKKAKLEGKIINEYDSFGETMYEIEVGEANVYAEPKDLVLIKKKRGKK
jgi:hypothetical protein